MSESSEPEIPDGMSASGNPVYRHVRTKPFEPVAPGPIAAAIEAHIEKHLGPIETVFHEIVSDLVHLDVYLVAPRPERNHWTLVTSGMSDRPMKAPARMERFRHLELMLALPPGWPLGKPHDVLPFDDERNYWPIRGLKTLARLPHEYDTWLWVGHTMPNGDPPAPFAPGTDLCCWMVTVPKLVPEAFAWTQVDPEKRVHFLAALPLYREEMELKLREGAEALEAKLDAAGVTELVDPRRRNVCRKRFLGLF